MTPEVHGGLFWLCILGGFTLLNHQFSLRPFHCHEHYCSLHHARIRLKWMVDVKRSETRILKRTNSSWWFQPNWKLSVKLDHFPIMEPFPFWKQKPTLLTSNHQVVIISVTIRANHMIHQPQFIYFFLKGYRPFCNVVLFVKWLNVSYEYTDNIRLLSPENQHGTWTSPNSKPSKPSC